MNRLALELVNHNAHPVLHVTLIRLPFAVTAVGGFGEAGHPP